MKAIRETARMILIFALLSLGSWLLFAQFEHGRSVPEHTVPGTAEVREGTTFEGWP